MTYRAVPWCLAALAAVLAGPAPGQIVEPGTSEPRGPRFSVEIPGKTDAGSWAGTWYYVSRVHQIALWMREDNGKPELKLRVFLRSSRESVETDWEAVGTYEHHGKDGRFWLEIDQRGPDEISGTWNWRLGEEGSSRIDRADFGMWRTGSGRRLALNLSNYEHWNEKDPERRLRLDAAWVFTKAARHHALWPELPF